VTQYGGVEKRISNRCARVVWSLAVVDLRGGDSTIAAMRHEMWAMHRETGLAAGPWSAQANGLFGKMARGALATLRPVHRARMRPRRMCSVSSARAVAHETGLAVNQVVLAYLTSQPFPTVPVVGPRSPEQLEDTLLAGDAVLSAAQAHSLDSAS
jgi:aryl-alcohol dehydrogenase-like predicted oxidoreductase